ncbi:MAG: winged helix-turn-helix domain-containing protein [Pseudomonadota bacterium]
MPVPMACAPGRPTSPPSRRMRAGLRLAGWTIDPTSREASDGERTRRLSPRAMQVLLVLADAEGAVVSRADLLDAVWAAVHVGDESLTQAVSELRRALGDARDGRRIVETVPKAGYRLAVPVLREMAPASASPDVLTLAGPVMPLEAHIALSEARSLARYRGVLAADEIDRLIEEARALAPDNASVLADYATLMGLAAVHAGQRNTRLRLATEAAEQAVRLRPDQLAPHRALGFVAGVQGQLELGLKSFSCALTIDPDDFETSYLAAQVCFGAGDAHKAMVLAERAADLRPDDYRPAYNAARAALRVGDADRVRRLAGQAVARIDMVLVAQPDATRFLSARAAAAAMLGGTVEAPESTLRRAVAGGLFYDVVSLAHRGAIPEALDVLEDLIERGWSYDGWISVDPVSTLLGRERRFARMMASIAA